VSPLTLRRYRAERLLRAEFEGLRTRVLGRVRRRLLASGVALDRSDLEACYGQAWQGLYAAVLDGHQIVNPAGWLVLVTFRRAIEGHRARGRAVSAGGAGELEGAEERDLAAELDDRIKLRQLFEGLRGRLSARELQAATLCYLHGLTRAEAAARMGVSEARLRKLMEGQGAERPGVAGKVGALVATIRDDRWCAEQASLMRGYAYGILDPEGDRYRLARVHREECPACRAYVISLRGLAAALPPVFPPWPLAASLLAGAAAQAGPGTAGTLCASGAAGAGGAAGPGGGAAGGSWLVGPLAGKLAAGCLLALGVGIGCVALRAGPGHGRHAHRRTPVRGEPVVTAIFSGASTGRAAAGARPSPNPSPLDRSSSSSAAASAGTLTREFGPEQGVRARSVAAVAARAQAARSVATVAGRAQAARSTPSASGAQREFGPG
jgi:DNA-directed RNA polymerase specialized sigma24 family protein